MFLALVLGLQTPAVPVGEPKIVSKFSITDSAIDESSGLGASRRVRGSYFTHNDSGDVARFFRFDAKGEVTGVYLLEGVKAVDWEDMEVATVSGKTYVYLADVGDNGRVREEIFVHRVREPEADLGNGVLRSETYRLKYPDRKNDCEAFLVDPKSGSLILVTKARDGKTSVYSTPAPVAGSQSTMKLIVDDLKINTGQLGGNLITGGSVSPDGKWVILKTYAGGYLYSAGENFESWVKSTPIPVQFPLEKQGEAVCFALDNRTLISSSEGNPCPIQTFLMPAR
jgi:hypothetical protein